MKKEKEEKEQKGGREGEVYIGAGGAKGMALVVSED